MNKKYSGLKVLHSFPMLVATVLCVSCGGGSSNGLTASSPGAVAAQQTALTNSYCLSSSPFYYEIGDKSGYITGGSIGGSTYTATTQIQIASGTKWLFGAYAAQFRNGDLSSAVDFNATHMVSEYHGLSGLCPESETVASCFAKSSPPTPGDIGKFYYDGGHFQYWGSLGGDTSLANMTAADLSARFTNTLGTPVTFKSPGLASGGYMTTNDYAAFLREILNNQLKIAALLGSTPVCTDTSATSSCPTTALNSPIPLAWHYSVGHWVEDNPAGIAPAGDGAFSSPGAFGFYPWIDSTKTYYGVLARETLSGSPVTDSVSCGLNIRKAFITGIPQ